MKLQTKISWLRFLWLTVGNGRFPDNHVPGQDVSRTGHFPDKTFPGRLRA